MISIVWFRKSPNVGEYLHVLETSPMMSISQEEADAKAEAGLLTVEADGNERPTGYSLVGEDGAVIKTRVL